MENKAENKKGNDEFIEINELESLIANQRPGFSLSINEKDYINKKCREYLENPDR